MAPSSPIIILILITASSFFFLFAAAQQPRDLNPLAFATNVPYASSPPPPPPPPPRGTPPSLPSLLRHMQLHWVDRHDLRPGDFNYADYVETAPECHHLEAGPPTATAAAHAYPQVLPKTVFSRGVGSLMSWYS